MTDTNVINFPRIGFNLTPTTLPNTPVVPPPATPDTTGDRARPSPLDSIAALADPGLTQPVIHVPAIPNPGHVPTTFLADPGASGDAIGPRLGALSLAAILAVAVAAVRGIHTAATTIRDRRQARQQERAEQTTSSLASGGREEAREGAGRPRVRAQPPQPDRRHPPQRWRQVRIRGSWYRPEVPHRWDRPVSHRAFWWRPRQPELPHPPPRHREQRPQARRRQQRGRKP
ncbi:hypothetical protein ACFQ0G_53095 [Streptomyces chiangmaiensis]